MTKEIQIQKKKVTYTRVYSSTKWVNRSRLNFGNIINSCVKSIFDCHVEFRPVSKRICGTRKASTFNL